MNTNIPALATVYDALQDALARLQAVDFEAIESANLVPMANAVKRIAEYLPGVDAQIQMRAIGNGELIPGVVVKDAVTHRKWNDPVIAAELAFKALGIAAFKLDSPAALEKLGDEGAALVAVASFKPPAGKRVVY